MHFQWEIVVAALPGLAAIITAAATYTKILGSLRAVKHTQTEVTHELRPNSGGSLKDQVTRLAEDSRRTNAELARVNNSLVNLNQAINTANAGMARVADRLASQDARIQDRADREHYAIRQEIGELAERIENKTSPHNQN